MRNESLNHKIMVKKTQKKQNKKFTVLPFEELVSQTNKLPKQETIWAGIKEGSFGIIYGPSKSGKTTFCENLALCLVVGKPNFWGRKLYNSKPHKVLFVGLEENCIPRADRGKKQISTLSDAERKLVGKNYLQPDCYFQQSIQGDSEWKLLRQAIKDSGAKIVFIDSLTRLYTGSLEESSTAKSVTLRLREMSRDLGITLIVIHHTTKSQGKPMSQDSIAGSRVIAQEADFAIGINRIINGTRYLKEVFYRYEKHSDTDVRKFSIDDNQWLFPGDVKKEYLLFERSDGRAVTKSLEDVKAFVSKSIDANSLITSKTLMQKFVNTAVISKPTLYHYLQKMCDQEFLKKENQGVYKLIGQEEEVSDES